MRSVLVVVGIAMGFVAGCAREVPMPTEKGAFVVALGGDRVALVVNARNGLRARLDGELDRSAPPTTMRVKSAECGVLEFLPGLGGAGVVLGSDLYLCQDCVAKGAGVSSVNRDCPLAMVEGQEKWRYLDE